MKKKPDITIKIYLQKKILSKTTEIGADTLGIIEHMHGENIYTIKLCVNQPLLGQIGTMAHELVHFMFMYYFSKSEISNEESICKKSESYIKKLFKKLMV